MNELERRVCEAIDADCLGADLSALVQVRSVTGDETDAQALMARLMGDAGLEVESWETDLDELRRDPGFPGAEAPRERAVGLSGRLGRGERRIALCGHIDTVPEGSERWRHDPYAGVIADGAVHGRGSLDMKGGLIAALHALRAIRASGLELDGEAVLQSVASEEDGGLGAFDAIRRLGRADGALILEPTSLDVVCAQAGALTFTGIVLGKAAHAAARLEGVSAIDRYLPIHERLQTLEDERNRDVAHPQMRELQLPYPILVGRLSAGEWSSTVPDRLVFEGRFGVLVGESIEDARAVLQAAIGDLCEIRFSGGQFASGETPREHPVAATALAAASDVRGVPARVIGVPWGADMRLYCAAGIPCVMCGAGGVELAHAVDERVQIDQLVAAAQIAALFVLRSLGTR